MTLAVIIAIASVSGILIMIGLKLIVFDRMKKRLNRLVRARFSREDMVLMSGASLFGQRSRGPAKVRGAGALVLSRQVLWFVLAVPEREITIPVPDIRSVTMPRSYQGKTIFRPLLCVRYLGPKGEDEIAWAVQEPEKWRQALETIRASLP